MQLAYSCTHLFSDTGHLLSTAPPSLEPVRWTRGRCEVTRTQNCMHFILQSWHEKYYQLDVYWWSAASSWFLLDETFAVVLTNGNTVADRCSTVLCTTATFAGAFSSADPARAVRDTDRPASGTTWSSPSPSPSPRCSWPWILVVGVDNAASRRVAVQRHGHLPNFCCYLAAGQPFPVLPF